MTLCSAFKMHKVKLWCSDGWMRFAVVTRNSEMRDVLGDLVVTKRMLPFAQFSETIRMPHCEPSGTHCQSPRRWFALVCRGLAILWNLYGGCPTRWQVSWNKFVSICVYNCSRSSVHTCAIIGGISSLGMRVGFITNMFGTGCGSHGMRIGLEWRTGPLSAWKLCWRFYGILTASMLWPCCLRVNRPTHDGSQIKAGSCWFKASFHLAGVQHENNRWLMLTMCRLTIQEWRETFSSRTHWRGCFMRFTHLIYLPRTFIFWESKGSANRTSDFRWSQPSWRSD
jgi:hypothetical protein